MTLPPYLQPARLAPSEDALFERIGLPPGRATQRHRDQAQAALARFLELAHPALLQRSVAMDDFTDVYSGEELNEHPAPLDKILPAAARLCVYALTMGREVSEEIPTLFRTGREAEGLFLDAAASHAAEAASERGGQAWLDDLKARGEMPPDSAVLPFSPGYCGWHLSGQKKLLAFVRAADIGITLNSSFLMDPLKTISGVWVAGPKTIFADDADYAFCSACAQPTCRERQRRILK
jgi:hypothetical protein